MKRRLLFASAALSWFAASVVSLKGQGVMKEARVTQVVKDVKILPAQAAPRPATLSDTVRGDTAIRTGVESRAELTFGDLTIARLGANTVFSFNEGSRTVDLSNGAILLRVPKGSGGAKIQTAAVTAAITGTTVIVEFHKNSYAKYLVLEGTMRIFIRGTLGESVLLHPGQMMILNPNATRLSEPVDFDLERLLKTSLFIQGFPPLPSVPLLANVEQQQLELKANGELIDTNLVIFGRGTLVTLTDPQSEDVIDRKTAAVTLPTPTATATSPPIPTPTATATAIPSPTPTATIAPSPTATPTPPPTPSKFGTPPPIVTFVPYPIDNGTTLQTDPAITRAGVTDFGKIYRDSGQDGAFSAWAFTATTPFDSTAGIDALYGANVPVAAFKFTALQLVGNPTISTANGGTTNLALISVGPITSATAGNAAFTFTGMQSVLLATQAGSIDITGPDITFQNIPLLIFYARGVGSNLTLGGMGIFGVNTLRLMAENNIAINAPESLSNGANGGTLTAISGGNLTVSSPIDTPTGFVPAGTFSGAGGNVSLTATNGAINVDSRIQVSYNDAGAGTGRRSASGGMIGLSSGLTTGTGISLTSNANLLSLLNRAAPGPGGSITLTTAGSDIVTNGATLEADRGTITIQHSAAPPAGTAQITLNGGAITSETLLAQSRGNMTVGTTSPVNIQAVTLRLESVNNNLTWSGGTSVATATASSGVVFIGAGNILNLTGPVDIQRFNGGITDGLTITLNGLQNFQASQSINLLTDGSGLTTGADIFLVSAGPVAIGGAVNLQTGPTTGNQGSGSGITIRGSGSGFNAADLLATVQLGAGRTLSNGGNILMDVSPYTATRDNGGLALRVINSAPGIIGTGGTIFLRVNGSLATGTTGGLNLLIDNRAGQIQTGGTISANTGSITGNFINAQVDNRFGGFIGNGGSISFTGGTTNLRGDASFTILNSQAGTPGGTIASNTFVNLILGDTTIGGNLNAFIDNSDGKIGGAGGSVSLQINGKLAVTNRIDVFGTLTSTGSISAGTFSVTNANAPAIDVGAGGITRFNFPSEPFSIAVPHVITTNALTSTGGINFNGLDYDPGTTLGPFSGGTLTINVPSLNFGTDIQGAVTFNGGSSPNNTIPAGDGGTFTVNATGAITVNNSITATTGLRTADPPPSGTGGNVNLNTTNGTVSINAPIKVSSNDTPGGGVPIRKSNAGGKINIQSNATNVAINISNTGQLLSLLDATAAGPGGKITILATATGSRVNVTGDPGSAGAPPADTIRADRGTVDVRNTGAGGFVSLTTTQIAADTVKIGALGSNGTLSIGGGRITADTLLKLYATGSNGSIVFVSDAFISSTGSIIIAANTVTVNNGVTVTVGGGKKGDVYVLDPNGANYTSLSGGNNSTTGTFILDGSAGSPTAGVNTHKGVGPPQPFDPAPAPIGGH
jgi:hypothetical protein